LAASLSYRVSTRRHCLILLKNLRSSCAQADPRAPHGVRALNSRRSTLDLRECCPIPFLTVSRVRGSWRPGRPGGRMVRAVSRYPLLSISPPQSQFERHNAVELQPITGRRIAPLHRRSSVPYIRLRRLYLGLRLTSCAQSHSRCVAQSPFRNAASRDHFRLWHEPDH
jgi:hypothetical protein